MMRFLLILLLIFTSASHADSQDEAMQSLLVQFDAADGDIENLITMRYAVDKALLEAAINGLEDSDFPTFGTGDTVIYEFSDYQCGYCRRMFPLVDAAVADGKATVKLIEFPILGELSILAARYALAAQQQGNFFEFHRQLMSNNGRLNDDIIRTAAENADLDLAQAEEYLNSAELQEKIDNNYRLAALLGVNGTPGFIINGQLYPGALQADDFNALLVAPIK